MVPGVRSRAAVPQATPASRARQPRLAVLGHDRVSLGRQQAGPAPRPIRWTLAVDLTANLEVGSGQTLGADRKAAELKKLAALTAGKPVVIVAQVATRQRLERFVIRDGRITDDQQLLSRGYGADLTDLLRIASTRFPSEHLGLHIQSHGSAYMGLAGDAGTEGLFELADAVARGLAGSSRHELDYLSLDACLEGQNEVLDQLVGVAAQVVASPEEENGYAPGIDGQPLAAVVKDLIAHPDLTPSELADVAVEQAARAARPASELPPPPGGPDGPGGEVNGTVTLSHYDMARYPAFAKALDAFGDALSAALAVRGDRARIAGAIDSTPRFAPDGKEKQLGAQQRDLKAFTARILDQVRSGALTDPDGRLLASAAAVQAAILDLVPRYYGQADAVGDDGQPISYAALGGIGVFLPDRRFFLAGPSRRGIDQELAAWWQRVSSPDATRIQADVQSQLARGPLDLDQPGLLPASCRSELGAFERKLEQLAAASPTQLPGQVAKVRASYRKLMLAYLEASASVRRKTGLDPAVVPIVNFAAPRDRGWGHFIRSFGRVEGA